MSVILTLDFDMCKCTENCIPYFTANSNRQSIEWVAATVLDRYSQATLIYLISKES